MNLADLQREAHANAKARGWWLSSEIIWAKPNPMPESVTDRPTRSHEYLQLAQKRLEAVPLPMVVGAA